jgi:hypothetical protein
MKRLIVFTIAALVLFTAATTLLWSHSLSTARSNGTADTMSLQELYKAAAMKNLPIEDFEDQSLVFSGRAKQ